jgi:hypothetical protein
MKWQCSGFTGQSILAEVKKEVCLLFLELIKVLLSEKHRSHLLFVLLIADLRRKGVELRHGSHDINEEAVL